MSIKTVLFIRHEDGKIALMYKGKVLKSPTLDGYMCQHTRIDQILRFMNIARTHAEGFTHFKFKGHWGKDQFPKCGPLTKFYWKLRWGPTAEVIGYGWGETARQAIRFAPSQYLKYKGEIYAERC